MYARCGELGKAQRVLMELPVRDVVIWTALIAGYAQQGKGEEALKCFDSMQREGISPNAVTFICALKACGSIRAAMKGEEIHEKVWSLGLLQKDIVLGNTLVDMYARCGAITKAQQVLNELPVRDAVTWNVLIAGYTKQGEGEEALKCLDRMESESHSPNVATFICALKACGSIGAGTRGEKIHKKIIGLGMLEKNVVLGSALVDMYARCSALHRSAQLLDELPYRNEVTWTALISGYVDQGESEEALKCFDSMQCEGHSADMVTFICALRACGTIGDIAKGEKIHKKIVNMGMLEKNIALGNALVDMYARCGATVKAQGVLSELPVRDVITWNALIAGYTRKEQGEEALKCIDNMENEGHSPSLITFDCALKACGSIGAFAKGEIIHHKIINSGMLEKDMVLGSTLVNMYAKCGTLAKAQQMLDELPIRNVSTWSALIEGYVEQGQFEEVLRCFHTMQCEGHTPDAITFLSVLKACGNTVAAAKGKTIHKYMVSMHMLEKDIILGKSLVHMYARYGLLAMARQVFNTLPHQDVVMWNALIAGFVKQGQGKEALQCFDSMQYEGHCPDEVTFICILKACASIGAAAEGVRIHNEIVHLGILASDVVLGTTLIAMYGNCGALSKAKEVLNEFPIQDVVMWNALLTAYVQGDQNEDVLKFMDIMQSEGHSPNVVTFICALKACGSLGAVRKGEKIHDKIVSLCMMEKDASLGNSLIQMYARCGALTKAQQVLNELPVKDVITWNTLIAGCSQQGQGEEALRYFDSMESEGHSPNVATFVCALKACGAIGAVAKGEKIHEKILSLGILENNEVLGSTLVDMYVCCGALAKAHALFEELPIQNMIMWTALIAGYVQQHQNEKAFNCFDIMQHEGHSPDVVTFICVLKACGSLGAIRKGEQVHDKIVSLGMFEIDSMLGNTLVDMYAKCAALVKAAEVFKELPTQNVGTWNALIGGYAQQGQLMETLNCLEAMQLKGVESDSNTFLSVLNSFNYSGYGDQAEAYFLRMSIQYGITPDIEHYCCMVDLFGRAGKFNKALQVIEKLPAVDYLPIWLALLGASFKWGDVKMGRFAFEHTLYLDKNNASAYVSMANVYVVTGT